MSAPTFTTEFANSYLAECFPPDLTNQVRLGRTLLRRVKAENSSTDLALAAYLVWQKLGEFKHLRFDYVGEDFMVVGEVSDLITDHDGELLAEIDPAVRSRVGTEAGGMSPEITAVHDLLLEVSASLAADWLEKELAGA